MDIEVRHLRMVTAALLLLALMLPRLRFTVASG